jgi:hypothetical protein
LGVVGGGIGKSHRYARCLDYRLTLDAGVFGRSPQWSSALAAELGVPAERVHQEVRYPLTSGAHQQAITYPTMEVTHQ